MSVKIIMIMMEKQVVRDGPYLGALSGKILIIMTMTWPSDFCDDDDACAQSDERDQILERRLVVSQVELLSHLNSI